MRNKAIPLAILAAVILLWHAASRNSPDVADWRFWIDATAPLALAAMAQTLVLVSGGQALAAGSIAIFVNALVAVFAGEGTGSLVVWLIAAPMAGGLIGLANGLLIGYARLPSTAVTLATGFIVQGLTLVLIEGQPPRVPPIFTSVLVESRVGGAIPASALVIAGAAAFWWAVSRTRFYRVVRLLARHEPAAQRAGARTRAAMALCYAAAGTGYGLTGLFMAAQLGSVDPLAGGPFLLQIYAAVVLGGTLVRLRRGDALGSLLGAFILTGSVNVLLAAGLSLHWSSAADAVWLVLGGAALLAPTLKRGRRLRWPAGLRLRPAHDAPWGAPWVVAIAAVVVADLMLPGSMFLGTRLNDLLVISVIMSVLALGLGVSILSGGIDLSMPSIIGVSGLAFVALLQGSDGALPLAAACVLAGGTLVGLLNATGIAGLGMPPALMTLASSGVVASLGASLTLALPMGYASPGLSWFMTRHALGVTPVVWALLPVCIGLAWWLQRRRIAFRARRFGQRGALVGADRRLLFLIYGLSGFLAAAGGALLAGYGGGLARVGQADIYFLPMLLAVSLAGVNVAMGAGGPLGILGGALAVTLVDTLLVRLDCAFGERLAVLGLLLLISTGLAVARPCIPSIGRSPVTRA